MSFSGYRYISIYKNTSRAGQAHNETKSEGKKGEKFFIGSLFATAQGFHLLPPVGVFSRTKPKQEALKPEFGYGNTAVQVKCLLAGLCRQKDTD